MTDILLSKPELPNDYIDCSVGEPYIIREKLSRYFDLSFLGLYSPSRWMEYPRSVGQKDLVSLLEEKYNAPVIITNGAKQALGACFYALKKMGKNSVAMRSPYWALVPPLATMHGLDSVFLESDNAVLDTVESYLCLAPNNPDGFVPTNLAEMSNFYKDRNIPFIHDAAYYTHSYLSREWNLIPTGDVQVYSVSKMFGISGLRLGFAVCHNSEFYSHIRDYMEAMTVGVSSLPQTYLYKLIYAMKQDQKATIQFEDDCFSSLQKTKKLLSQISPEVLEIPSNVETLNGMFGWFKVGPKADFKKSKINFVTGNHFGMPGMVRMNLAFDEKIMQEIVNRLNGALQ